MTHSEYCDQNFHLKVGCFAGFCHHRVSTMSPHTHAYQYPLFESGTKARL